MSIAPFWRKTNFRSWSLFLDRDGVINKRLTGDYVKNPDEWVWLDNVIPSLKKLAVNFKYIFIVSNQQGVGKGIMSEEDLKQVTKHFLDTLQQHAIEINGVYYCTELASKPGNCRKPAPKLAEDVKRDFPDVQFEQSVMAGDMPSDIKFGQQLGMTTVWIHQEDEDNTKPTVDFQADSLSEMASWIQ